MGVNKVILVGNAGKDPEVRYLDNGTAYARLTLATSETYKNKNGEKVTHTEWHNLVFWRGLAEIVEKWVKKGHSLYVEGKIRTSKSEKDGQVKYFTDIVVDNMEMLGSKGGGDNRPVPADPMSNGSNQNNDQNNTAPTDDNSSFSENEDDLPF